MFKPGVLNLNADRYTPFVATVTFSGIDLTDAVMAMEVRDRPDGGTVRAALATVTLANAQGVRLVSTGTVEGVATSIVAIRINEATMEAMPTAPEIGDDLTLYWDMHITPDGGVKQVYLRGTFTIRAGVTQ